MSEWVKLPIFNIKNVINKIFHEMKPDILLTNDIKKEEENEEDESNGDEYENNDDNEDDDDNINDNVILHKQKNIFSM